jgi:hypothetical protein
MRVSGEAWLLYPPSPRWTWHARHAQRENPTQRGMFAGESLAKPGVAVHPRSRLAVDEHCVLDRGLVLLSPRQSLRVLAHHNGAGASLRIQQPVAE